MSIAKWLLAKKLGGGSPFPPVIKRVTGNPIEFTDGADAPLVKCVTEITGSQDLHGYDKPWVGGAGKNKLEVTGTSTTVNGVTFTINSDGTVKANGTASDITTWIIGWITVESGKTYTLSGSPNNPSVNSYWIDVRDGSSIYNNWTEGNPTYTATETKQVNVKIRIASGYTVNNLVFKPQIEEGSTATTFAPYSNICPITAYTEGEIVERGKNLFDKSATDTSNGYVANYNLRYDGREVLDTDLDISEYIKITPDTKYILEGVSGSTPALCFYDESKTYISGIAYGITWGTAGNVAFTSPSNAVYIRFSIPNFSIDAVQLEKGESPSTYEPYVGTTHTTTYPSAIYRGSEDVVNGEVTSEMPVIDLGDLSWSAYTTDTTGHSFYVNVPNGTKSVSSDSSVANMVCENYGTVAFINPSEWLRRDAIICQVPNAQRWIVRDERYSDVTSFTSSISGVKLAYELATPTTSSVTPTNLPIKSLSGYNHIESSTGEMVVDYITDAYQNFVNTVESALPNTRKGGVKAFDIFATLDNPSTDPEPDKDSDEDDKKEEVKEETKDDMR